MRRITGTAVVLAGLVPMLTSAQINFTKSGYYVGMGDSIAAGEGAMPVTGGYVYDLYNQGLFGRRQETDFANIAVRGARSWDLRDHQVAQVLCAEPAQRPTVVTITAGANDFFRGDFNVPAIALRVVDSINVLLNNDSGLVASPVLDPVTGLPCRALEDVTILVSNYYRIPHPDPATAALLDSALSGFDQALRAFLPTLSVPPGSRVGLVDLYSASAGHQGLVLIERRLGVTPFDFEVHPTNLGHTFIADQFKALWQQLQ